MDGGRLFLRARACRKGASFPARRVLVPCEAISNPLNTHRFTRPTCSLEVMNVGLGRTHLSCVCFLTATSRPATASTNRLSNSHGSRRQCYYLLLLLFSRIQSIDDSFIYELQPREGNEQRVRFNNDRTKSGRALPLSGCLFSSRLCGRSSTIEDMRSTFVL